MTKIAIVYGTSGGNTKLVCEQVAIELKKWGHKVDMHRVIESSEQVFDAYKTIVLASPTYGHGQLDPHIITFYDDLEGKIDFTGKQCAVIGLGDSKYDDDYNVESARILAEFATRHGGESLIHPLMINKCPIPHLHGTVIEWAKELNNSLK